QASIDTRKTLSTKRGEAKAALDAVGAADAERAPLDAGVGRWVKSQFGPYSLEARDFGLAEKTRAARSVADKARSADQALATRKARGTMGRKARAKIKGVLPAIAPVAVTPQPAAQPATNGVAPHA